MRPTGQYTDGPGLPFQRFTVTEMFFQRGLRVEVMHTQTKLAPFGGTVLFVMDGMVVAEKPIDMEELQAASEDLSNELNIDIDINPDEGQDLPSAVSV
jgi:glycine cleavage system regulatory protein